MTRKRSKGPFHAPHKKIVLAISELASCQQAPSAKALRLFLHGDDLLSSFSLLDGYGSMNNLSARKLGVYLKTLEDNGCLRVYFDDDYEETYYYLTEQGVELAENYRLKKRETPAKQSRPKPLFRPMDE